MLLVVAGIGRTGAYRWPTFLDISRNHKEGDGTGLGLTQRGQEVSGSGLARLVGGASQLIGI